MPHWVKFLTHCATFLGNTDTDSLPKILINICVINTQKSYQRHYQLLKKNLELKEKTTVIMAQKLPVGSSL